MRYLLKNGARKIERILDARAGRFSTAKNRGDNKEANYHMSMLRGMSEVTTLPDESGSFSGNA